ncbi:sugar phosphate isomerase/epimerase [Flagellimonas sp. CMM7]|uniref:sugar phosphate isomerase/epimerase family protein n=1 Tax=Flagellimonas sp. CMM7 TaxID=2654676 RepID=UPI0013D25FE3|nr:sugar phosphate isomerase/epimerase family protein [Flagellimonas sp. CMM7]UII80386.1 sugar phosphate isomerase/epimerase [Flagellimonas sp. CMM7]
MKVGIDSYCYHRFFGEVYPGQDAPEKTISLEEFLDKAIALNIDGLSLESCFIPQFDDGYLANIKRILDNAGLDRVYAWGHPDGLEGGTNLEAYDEMIAHIDYATKIGADVMRVVGSSHLFRFEAHDQRLDKLTEMFRSAVQIAKRKGVRLAIENHIDFDSDEVLKLIKAVDSEYFGVNFDTGNFLRVLDDPIQGMKKLAPYVFATHIKDLLPVKEIAVNEWNFFSCVPTGLGIIDNSKLIRLLKDADYKGFLAVEIDNLHPDYSNKEEKVIAASIKELKKLATLVSK